MAMHSPPWKDVLSSSLDSDSSATSSTCAPQSFRFLDLPPEVRNNIYGLWLTAQPFQRTEPLQPIYLQFPEPGDNLPKYSFGLEPNILRTCRFVKTEGDYILRRNLFVKLVTRLNDDDFECLWNSGVPYLNLNLTSYRRVTFERFESFQLSYEISTPRCIRLEEDGDDRDYVEFDDAKKTYILLHSDLDSLLSLFAEHELKIDHRLIVSHVVTIPNCEPLPCEELQGRLVAPFRARLSNMRRFEFQGAISENLKASAEQDILLPFPTSPKGLISELEEWRGRGSAYCFIGIGDFRDWDEDDNGKASEYWNEGLRKIDRAMLNDAYQEIRDEGGLDFLNQLSALSYELSSKITQHCLECIERCMTIERRDGFTDEIKRLAATVCDAVSEAVQRTSRYTESTWQPDPTEWGSLQYSKAVACQSVAMVDLRMIKMLAVAEAAIQEASILDPDSWEIDTVKREITSMCSGAIEGAKEIEKRRDGTGQDHDRQE